MSKQTSHNLAALLLGMLGMMVLVNAVLLGAWAGMSLATDSAEQALSSTSSSAFQTEQAAELRAFEYNGNLYVTDSDGNGWKLPSLADYTTSN